MPKFLDAPSWYDSSGVLRTAGINALFFPNNNIGPAIGFWNSETSQTDWKPFKIFSISVYQACYDASSSSIATTNYQLYYQFFYFSNKNISASELTINMIMSDLVAWGLNSTSNQYPVSGGGNCGDAGEQIITGIYVYNNVLNAVYYSTYNRSVPIDLSISNTFSPKEIPLLT